MKPMILLSDDLLSADARITHAAKPYFARISLKPSVDPEERYPKTASLLFQVALKIVDGKYGEKIQETLPAAMEAAIYPADVVFKLLQKEAKSGRSYEIDVEIFDLQGLRDDVSEADREGLLVLFHDYLANLLSKSHITVEMLLKEGLEERAFSEALKLQAPYDKVKAINKLVIYNLHRGRGSEAIALFHLIPEQIDSRELINQIVCQLLRDDGREQALSFIRSLKDKTNRASAVQTMSLWLAKEGQWKLAASLLGPMEVEKGVKEYSKSLISSSLAAQGKVKDAKELAFSIVDEDFRLDAFSAILRGLLRTRKIDEAEAFAKELTGKQEMKEATRIIESGLKAYQQDQRIRKIQKEIGQKGFGHKISRSDFAN